jgi:hypothetical protein
MFSFRGSGVKRLATATALLALSASPVLAGTYYTSEAAFLANVGPVRYTEDFSNFTFGNPLNGSQTSWVAPGANGFGFTANAVGGLWSNLSALSTNNAFDPIIVNFSGSPVTAVGGNFTNTDINGNVIPGTIIVTLSDGSTQQLVNQTLSSYLGYTSNGPTLTSITVVPQQSATNGWAQIDHFTVGTQIPEPTAVCVLAGGLGLLVLRRRRA